MLNNGGLNHVSSKFPALGRVDISWVMDGDLFVHQIYVMWGPVYENAKLVNITPITMVYGTQITSDNYTSYGPMGQNSAWSKIG